MEIAAGDGKMTEDTVRRLKKLKGSRTGKKGSITKRINQLEKFVEEKQGRRATQLLVGALETVYRELEEVCEEISNLDEEYDPNNDIEDVRFQVETCVAIVTQHLEARKEDTVLKVPVLLSVGSRNIWGSLARMVWKQQAVQVEKA